MTLSALRSQLSAFHPVSTALADFKSFLELYINAEPQTDNSESVQGLKDGLTVEMLYQRELLTGPNTLFRILRDNFVLKGCQYVPCSRTRRLIEGAINSFFANEEEKAYAMQRIENIRLPPSLSVSIDRSTQKVVSTSYA